MKKFQDFTGALLQDKKYLDYLGFWMDTKEIYFYE